MNVLKDNTGIHSTARCCEGRGKSETDVLDLLQFATELIFCDEIFVSTYEPESVRTRTADFHELLQAHFNAETYPLILRPFTSSGYAKICQDAAFQMLKDYENQFPRFGTHKKHGLLPDLKPQDLRDVAAVTKLITKPLSKSEERDIAYRSLHEKAGGVSGYLLSCNPALLELVRRRVLACKAWTDANTLNLISDVRYRLNENIAQVADATEGSVSYAPAVARAQRQRKQLQTLIAKLSDIVAQEVKDELVEPLSLPTMVKALVIRSKGEPAAVVEEAVRLRDMAAPVRRRLAKIRPKSASSQAWKFRREQELKAIGEELHWQVYPDSKPRFLDVFEYHSVLSTDVPWPNVAKALEYWRLKGSSSRVAVLSELSATILHDGDFMPFIRNCEQARRRMRESAESSSLSGLPSFPSCAWERLPPAVAQPLLYRQASTRSTGAAPPSHSCAEEYRHAPAMRPARASPDYCADTRASAPSSRRSTTPADGILPATPDARSPSCAAHVACAVAPAASRIALPLAA